MNRIWFIFKDKLHSIEPKIDGFDELWREPVILAGIADVDFAVKRDLRALCYAKSYLDRKYGPDPDYLPIIISEEKAQQLISELGENNE